MKKKSNIIKLSLLIWFASFLIYLASYNLWWRIWWATDVNGTPEYSATVRWHARIHRFGEIFYQPMHALAAQFKPINWIVEWLEYKPKFEWEKNTNT
jgi:hypothetical protein